VTDLVAIAEERWGAEICGDWDSDARIRGVEELAWGGALRWISGTDRGGGGRFLAGGGHFWAGI